MNNYISFWKKAFDFSGRSGRKEYWIAALLTFVIYIILVALDVNLNLGFLGPLWMILNAVPGLAVSVRRLHDIDKTGWLVLLNLVPIVGIIILIVFACSKGNANANRFGSPPIA